MLNQVNNHTYAVKWLDANVQNGDSGVGTGSDRQQEMTPSCWVPANMATFPR